LFSSKTGFDDDSFGSDTPLKHPPKILLVVGLLLVLLGTLIGVYGILNLNFNTASQQSLIGAVGYLLTVVGPIALLQLVRMRHISAMKVNVDEPYDIYAGQRLQSHFLKVVVLGLACASLSIIVFFWPIAQGLA
jgi:uncharacterized membrane protein HdeD (DUF308 family)